ncbi:Hypothetical protein A7982_00485 [Minicystis rosea]|nr:Hypothetical protein A7982_00485 [Minicystis rosea]
MHQVIFYPVGNGDTSQIILENGKRILLDYRHLTKAENDEGPEINLKARLRKELRDADKNSFDVVAFTHGDSDHICGSTDFFELRHAKKYQGGNRVPIPELWVPAAMVLEEGTHESRADEFIIWRQEARHRLREGSGIRVFSKPEKLKSWFDENDIPFESRRHLITDAGELVPGFDLGADGIEFFCHSPFIKHVDGAGDDMRNSCALIFNIRFQAGTQTFDFLAVGDSEWEVLEDIVEATRAHDNDDRLEWDLYNIPHHCSYLALSDEKGERETTPKPLVRDLLLAGRQGAYIISSSNPLEDNDAAREKVQPPHVQARKCYERHLTEIAGAQFLVTMEEPSTSRPEPIVFNIDPSGITRERKILSAPAILVSSPAPRAG